MLEDVYFVLGVKILCVLCVNSHFVGHYSGMLTMQRMRGWPRSLAPGPILAFISEAVRWWN